MRKLYVPISMDPEHNQDLYREDFKKLGVSHVFLTEPDRLVYKHGECYELAMENARKHIQIYEDLGYECGVWISTLGYGHPLFTTVESHKETFRWIRSVVGCEKEDAICPTDQNFVARICRIITDFAKAGAKMIMLDDELCLSL